MSFFFFPKWKGFQNLLVSQKCNFLNLDFWCSCNSKVGWQHLREMGFYSLLPLCARQAGGGDCGQAGSAVRWPKRLSCKLMWPRSKGSLLCPSCGEHHQRVWFHAGNQWQALPQPSSCSPCTLAQPCSCWALQCPDLLPGLAGREIYGQCTGRWSLLDKGITWRHLRDLG